MIEAALRDKIRANWGLVCEEVAEAARQSQRSPDEVRIVGVSKYVDGATTAALIEAGCHELGESRPQHLWEKSATLSATNDVHWHLIGHLQRNKIRRTLPTRPTVHSVDSPRLLHALADEAIRQELVVTVLLEVNISGDDAKTGLSPEELAETLDQRPDGGVRIDGLMAMAGWGTDANEARHQFAMTRELRDRMASQGGLPLQELSMGMSGDFREAIAEGATIVRIGSSLFEGVPRR